MAAAHDPVSDRRQAALVVDTVTLLEDRAHVVRRGSVPVETGATRVIVAGVSPVLVDKTLNARVRQGAGRVVNATIERRRVVPDPAELVRRIDEDLAEKTREEDRLEGLEELSREQLARLDQAARLLLGEITEDVAWGRKDPERWTLDVEAVHAAESARSDALVGHQEALKEIRRVMARLRQRRSALERPTVGYAADLVLDLEASRPGELEIELGYIVPCACWRPVHQARLLRSEGGHRVVFTSEGCVWQNTGEDWNDVAVVFSTERPSLGVRPPELQPDLLRLSKSSSAVVVETHQEKIHTAGLGARRVSPEVPGVDDGGQALALRAARRATIPSDGRPCRVPVFGFEGPATLELVCAPELAEAVILRTEQDNTALFPVLAGPVDLVRDSGRVGRTTVLFVAQGERFALGWGPDPALRVHREEEHLREETRMLSSWSSVDTRVRVRLSNLGPEDVVVQVTERVPVSEVEKVEVRVDAEKTTPGETGRPPGPDPDGFLRWNVRLPGRGTGDLKLGWTLRKHSDVSGL